MKKSIIFILLIFVVVNCFYALSGNVKHQEYSVIKKSGATNSQFRDPSLFSGSSTLNGAKERTKRLIGGATTRGIDKKNRPNSAYYSNVVKRNGWFEGVGKPLTRETASHLFSYYKLSQKNSAGHWTLMEAYDGLGRLTTYHNIGTFLVNQFNDDDKGANAAWREKLRTVCKWSFIGDNSDKNVVQEVGLDENDNIVYVFVPMKVGEREYVGTYLDAWGMPVFLRTDSLGNDIGYANYVHIHLDNRGYIERLTFADRRGNPQRDYNGAFANIKHYDDKGRQDYEASLNIMGNRMIDHAGNCGWRVKYCGDTAIEALYFDADEKPIAIKSTCGEIGNIYGYRTIYDKYGRDSIVDILGRDGKPAVSEKGVARLLNRYSKHGLLIERQYFDSLGKLTNDSLGVAVWKREINSFDLDTCLVWLSADGKYVNAPYACKQLTKYDKSWNIVSFKSYRTTNGDDLVLHYTSYTDSAGNEVQKWADYNLMRIDSYDSGRRYLGYAYFDLSGNPVDHDGALFSDDAGLHSYTKNYQDSITIIETYLKSDGSPFLCRSGYYKNITQIDTMHHQYINTQYAEPDVVRYKFVKQFNDDFSEIQRQWDLTLDGKQARVGWWDNDYYECIVDYNMYGVMTKIQALNEFGEPAYMYRNSDNKVFTYLDINASTYYDEFGNEIENNWSFSYNLPRAVVVEVTKPAVADSLGICNGDVIVSYGDWRVDESLKNYDVKDFYAEAIVCAEKTKSVTLLRHDPEADSSKIVRINNLRAGRLSDLGIYPRMIYYTQKERQRLVDVCRKNGVSLESLPYKTTKDVVLLMPRKRDVYSSSWYNSGYCDPVFVLAANNAEEATSDETLWEWSIRRNREYEYSKGAYFKMMDADLYVTDDLSALKKSTCKYYFSNAERMTVQVGKDVYNKLIALRNKYDNEIPSDSTFEEMASSVTTLYKPKQLVGDWMLDVEGFVGHLLYTFDKKGLMWLNFEMEQEVAEGSFVKMTAKLTKPFEWELDGKVLYVSHSGEVDSLEDFLDLTADIRTDDPEVKRLFDEKKENSMDELRALLCEFLKEQGFFDTEKYVLMGLTNAKMTLKNKSTTFDMVRVEK
ncbi:MAG: hypothetical protein ACI31D_06645 [Candidatus Limisoma sp.]